MLRMRGTFVVLEGIDGSGKSTLALALAERLGDAKVTSEPTQGPIGAALRSGELGDLPPAAEALLFAADRALHTEEINRLLGERRWVICDRYFASTVAYQSAAMGGDSVGWLIEIQRNSVMDPDMTILLDVDPRISMPRVEGRGEARSRFEELGYLCEVRRQYLSLAECYGYRVIDASKSKEEVLEEALAAFGEKGLYASE